MKASSIIPTFALAVLIAPQLQAAADIDLLPVRGEWVQTSTAPIGAREGASIVWNGAEIFVFGGTESICPPNSLSLCIAPSTPPYASGAAAYNPLTDEWRTIASPPVGIIGSEVAAVGSDFFALIRSNYNQLSPQLLRYRSALDTWDEYKLPESTVSVSIVSFGADILLYGSTDEGSPASDWLLETLTGRWVKLPDDPLGPGFNRQYVAHGDTLYLFDHALVPSPGGEDGPSYLRAAKFENQQWTLLPTANSIGSAPTLRADNLLIAPELGCADGGHTNNYGRCIAFGAVFDTTTEIWHELPNAPNQGRKGTSISGGGISATDLVLRQLGFPVLDAVNNDWFTAPLLDNLIATERSVRAVGPYGFVFGGSRLGFRRPSRALGDSWIWKF